MEADGYSLDDKRTPIDEINYGDIHDILERFNKRFKENNENRGKKHFFVPLQEIEDNDCDLSINKYREEEEEKINHRESKIVIEEAKKEVRELLEGFDKLSQLVK
jgi:type I restriction enzyme M protein